MEHEVCVPDNWKFAALENISVNYNVNETRLDIGSRLDLSLSLFKVKKNIYIYITWNILKLFFIILVNNEEVNDDPLSNRDYDFFILVRTVS